VPNAAIIDTLGQRRRGARPRRRCGVALLVAALCAVLVLVSAACGGGGDQSDSSADVALPEGGSADADSIADLSADGGGAEAAGGGADALTATPELAVAAADRRQVFTADLRVKVDSLDAAIEQAAAAVAAVGGFAATEDVDLADSSSATITYRVPAPQFRTALADLADVGELRSQTLDSTDVSAQYADLESRLVTLRTSITRLQGFLSDTTDVNQIASLEGELTRREAELESIEGQRRALADQVELSTITVAFDATRATPATSTDPDRPGFAGGLEAGWDVAVGVVAAAAATAGFLLPFVPLLLVAAVVLWLLRRRARRDHPEGTPTPA
jgi:hypothetical protein